MHRGCGSLVAVALIAILVLSGCSGRSFVVIEDAPKGALPTQTLALRAVVDTGALSPTERYSWLELCDRVVTPVLKVFTSVEYKNCEPVVGLQGIAHTTTTTGWVAGIVGPVIQTGMTAGAIAYAGHEIGKGLGRSGSQTTNTNSTTGGSSSATGGSSNASATGGVGVGNGGQGGVGNGGQGGVGNGGQGGVGNGGQGGNGGLGGNGGQGGLGGNGGQGGNGH